MIRSLTTAAAVLALAGCSAPDGNVADTTNEAAVEATIENEQSNLVAEIDADAAEDRRNAATLPDEVHAYTCTNGTSVDAVYTDDGNARISIAGKSFALAGVQAASGGKYHGAQGLKPGHSLTWWTKGDSAMLIQAPKGTAEGSEDESLVNCQEND